VQLRFRRLRFDAEEAVQAASRKAGVEAPPLRRMMMTDDGVAPQAGSRKNAIGPMQLMPGDRAGWLGELRQIFSVPDGPRYLGRRTHPSTLMSARKVCLVSRRSKPAWLSSASSWSGSV